VTVSVRPECWVLSREAPVANAVRGRIGASVYLGEFAQHELVAGELNLKIVELNPRFLDQPDRGEVYAGAEPEDVVVLTA
jgi:iron(III) transport system ATP-binding protein